MEEAFATCKLVVTGDLHLCPFFVFFLTRFCFYVLLDVYVQSSVDERFIDSVKFSWYY